MAMDRSRRRVASFVAVVAVLSRVIDAITLRSSDAIEYNVSTSAAVGHSKLLREVVGACGDNTAVPLPTVGGTELELIVEFINAFEVDDVDAASQWIKDRFLSLGLDAQCRMLAAATYLHMPSLINATVSHWRAWDDLSAMRRTLHTDVFGIVVDRAPGLVRLRGLAKTDNQMAIAKEIHSLIAFGGNDVLVNRAKWTGNLTVLHWAAHAGDDLIVELLLNVPGIDVNVRDETQRTPLHWALDWGRGDVAERLLKAATIDVNARDAFEKTPLHWASRYGQVQVVKVLLKASAINVNARDSDGMTPLHRAVSHGNTGVVAVLVNAPRINLGAMDNDNLTALDWAFAFGFGQIVQLLKPRYHIPTFTSPGWESSRAGKKATGAIFKQLFLKKRTT
ncbi:hypothetical protein PBRA_002139 [Plasmodiophora brassicae]|uniref:SKP1 component POZ domain-containing protein n=1 Tax=Plasmodiophora brassicae TaxID=37360 RepID=A0A0G4J1L5_PLABS|nr:hypothetical protein PBRA_002139 [Plasmodiophora brassicae]